MAGEPPRARLVSAPRSRRQTSNSSTVCVHARTHGVCVSALGDSAKAKIRWAGFVQAQLCPGMPSSTRTLRNKSMVRDPFSKTLGAECFRIKNILDFRKIIRCMYHTLTDASDGILGNTPQRNDKCDTCTITVSGRIPLQQPYSGTGKVYTKWTLRTLTFSEILGFRTEDMRLDLSQKTQQGIVNKNALCVNLHQGFPSWPALISFLKKHHIFNKFRLTESTRVQTIPVHLCPDPSTLIFDHILSTCTPIFLRAVCELWMLPRPQAHFLNRDFAFYNHSAVNPEINTEAVVFFHLQTFSEFRILFH